MKNYFLTTVTNGSVEFIILVICSLFLYSIRDDDVNSECQWLLPYFIFGGYSIGRPSVYHHAEFPGMLETAFEM